MERLRLSIGISNGLSEDDDYRNEDDGRCNLYGNNDGYHSCASGCAEERAHRHGECGPGCCSEGTEWTMESVTTYLANAPSDRQ